MRSAWNRKKNYKTKTKHMHKKSFKDQQQQQHTVNETQNTQLVNEVVVWLVIWSLFKYLNITVFIINVYKDCFQWENSI